MFEIKANDTLPSLKFQLLDRAGTDDEGPLDVTGCNVRFFYSMAGQPGFREAKVDMLDHEQGLGQVSWVPGNTAVTVDTDCQGEFQIQRPDGHQMTVPAHGYVPFKIRADINKA